MVRAALYVRVSSLAQAREGYSLEFQQEILKEFCAREQWSIAGIYQDGGKTGSSMERSGLQTLVADAGTRAFDVVLIFRVDRFSRDPVDLLYLIKVLESYGIRLKSVTESVDASDPAGELMLTILGAIGKFVRRNIIQNAMLGKTKRAEAGLYTGGGTPFGYSVDAEGRYRPDTEPWHVGQSPADIVSALFVRYRALAERGLGLRTLARELNGAGVPSPENRQWSVATLHQILTHPVYTGEFVYGRFTQPMRGTMHPRDPAEWVRVATAHPPLVTAALWSAVQESLRHNRTQGRPPQVTAAAHGFLTGFLRCAHCGRRLAARHHMYRYRGQSSPRLHYTCQSRQTVSGGEQPVCSFPYVRAEYIEDAVWPLLVDLVERPASLSQLLTDSTDTQARRQAHDREHTRLLQERTRAEAAITRMVDAYAEGLIPKDQYARKMRDLNARLDTVQDSFARLAATYAALPPLVDADVLRAHLRRLLRDPSALTNDDKRLIIQKLVDPDRGITISADLEVVVHLLLPMGEAAAPPTHDFVAEASSATKLS